MLYVRDEGRDLLARRGALLTGNCSAKDADLVLEAEKQEEEEEDGVEEEEEEGGGSFVGIRMQDEVPFRTETLGEILFTPAKGGSLEGDEEEVDRRGDAFIVGE